MKYNFNELWITVSQVWKIENVKFNTKCTNFGYRFSQKHDPMEKFGFHIRNQRPQKHIMVCQLQKKKVSFCWLVKLYFIWTGILFWIYLINVYKHLIYFISVLWLTIAFIWWTNNNRRSEKNKTNQSHTISSVLPIKSSAIFFLLTNHIAALLW